MKTVVTSTELRKNISRVLDDVENGNVVHISRHGRIVAEVVPAAGESREPSWKRPGLRLAVKGASLTRAILEERNSGR